MSTTYDVFARKEHPEPLVYIGSVNVEGADDAPSAALKEYGPESEWLEMLAVPHQYITVVFSEYEEDNR